MMMMILTVSETIQQHTFRHICHISSKNYAHVSMLLHSHVSLHRSLQSRISDINWFFPCFENNNLVYSDISHLCLSTGCIFLSFASY